MGAPGRIRGMGPAECGAWGRQDSGLGDARLSRGVWREFCRLGVWGLALLCADVLARVGFGFVVADRARWCRVWLGCADRAGRGRGRA